jgi:23S rRNA G2445 N2-methylase RlmL
MERVYGVDIKKSRIEKARHNAKLYGVEKKTKFIVGSVLDEKILKNIKAEVAVLDPGWRLPDALPYSFVPSIRDTQPNLKKLFDLTKKNITPNIVLRIPPNFTQSMIKCFGVCRIENIITEGKVRFKIAYFLEDTKVCEVSEVHFPDFKYPERIKNYIKEKLCKR